MVELKRGPPYTFKLLKPSNGKNPLEPKNEKFVARTYIFGVTKCDKIFYLLAVDGQIIVPERAKVPSLEQRKKKGFCKFHKFWGHKTSQCALFRDLMQNALKDERLKFVDKQKPRPEEDVETKAKALFVDLVDIIMVYISNKVGAEDNNSNYEDQASNFYPKAEEELIKFLSRRRLKDSEVMLCPWCNSVFGKEVSKEFV